MKFNYVIIGVTVGYYFEPNRKTLKRFLVDKVGEKNITRNYNSVEVNSQVGSETDANFFFDVAGLSYCNENQLQLMSGDYATRLGKPDFQAVVQQKQETQVVITIHHPRKEIILGFRGSVNQANWDANFEISQTPLGNDSSILVHSGFRRLSNELAPGYLKVIKGLKESLPNYNYVLVGHSLGGALATLSSIEINNQLNISWKFISVFTYGMPRVGNQAFANLINQTPMRFTRVVNQQDPVPKVPFGNGYSHIHTEMFLSDNTCKVCKTDQLEDPTCSLKIPFSFNMKPHSQAWDKVIDKRFC